MVNEKAFILAISRCFIFKTLILLTNNPNFPERENSSDFGPL